MELPEIRNKVDINSQFIDGTPDGNYAVRILKAFRERCNEKWIVEGMDKDTTSFYGFMNDCQDSRAKELDIAIAKLMQEIEFEIGKPKIIPSDWENDE